MATFLSGNITDTPFENGFFIRGDTDTVGVNYYGEKLYNAYKNSGAPRAFTSASQTLQGVTFASSDYSKFYYGCYRSNVSRYPNLTKYFAIFYLYNGETSFPSISVKFPKAFYDKTVTARDIQITLQVNKVKKFSETLTGKLIPIFAFENKDQPVAGTDHYKDGQTLGDDALGWIYPYAYQYVQMKDSSGTPWKYYDEVGDGYNIPENNYGIRVKTTYAITNPASGTELPLFILDMNNPESGTSRNEAGFSSEFSESCIVPNATATSFYRGNSDNHVYLKNTDVTSPVAGTRFYGDYTMPTQETGGYWDGANYELACGVSFITTSGASIYTAGSVGVTQLFPNLSSESKKITFNVSANGGTISGATTSTVFINNPYGGGSGGWPSASKASTAAYTYTFKGWYSAASGGTKINSSTKVTSSSASTLYAQFTATPVTYNITYSNDGGTPSTVATFNYGTSITINNNGGSGESSFTVTENKTISNPTKTGYTFKGYTLSGTTLTANWEANSYIITYNYVDGTPGASNPTEGTFDISLNISNPTRVGYTFTGWTASGLTTSTAKYGTSSGSINTSWSSGSTKVTAQYFINLRSTSGTVRLTANWEIVNYTITYVLGSDTVINDNPSTYTVEDENILLQDPIREGYQFLGWSPEGYIEAGSTGNKTFTANWFKVPGDFTPKPGHDAEENGDFGIDINELDDSKYYQLILELNGDRDQYPYEYTEGIDYSQYGIDAENNKWMYDSGIVKGEELKRILLTDSEPYIFPMDIWRCRIHHSSGKLNVTLNLFESAESTTPIGSAPVSKDFTIESENKPHITNLTLHEGVVNIKNLDLGATNQESTRRFIGNKKSSVIATIYASNKSNEGEELLYEAVPCQFIVRLDGVHTGRSDANWDTGDIERILTSDQISELVASYNGGEMEYPCEDVLITEDPFPSINSDLPNARLRIKIWDSRRE